LETAVLLGFVGLHSHADFSLLAQPRVPSKLAQGVTTDVVGNRGFSILPEPNYWIKRKDKCGVDAANHGSQAEYLTHPTISNIAILASPCFMRSRPVLEWLISSRNRGAAGGLLANVMTDKVISASRLTTSGLSQEF
jgi:hypothetical protein